MAYSPRNINGQATKANSSPVTLASDQELNLPTGASTAAKQDTGNTSLSSIDTKLTGGTQQTKITDGTNIVNVLKSDGTAVGQNAELVSGTYLSVPFSTTTVQAVGTTDAGNYSTVSVQINTQGTSSSISFQVSNDNTNWTSQPLWLTSTTNGNGLVASTSSASVTYYGTITSRYFRINVTGISAGTTAGVIVFQAIAKPMITGSVGAIQSGTWTVGSNTATGSATPANAFYVGLNSSGGNLIGLRGVSTSGDGFLGTGGGNALDVASENFAFNGTNNDRMRNNITGVVIAAGATSTNAGVSTTTYNASKAVILINVSAYTSGSLTVTVNGVSSSGYVYPILASTALAATGVVPLRIFPGSTPSANAVANDMVPRTLQVVVTGTFVATYGIDYELSV